ncbi:MAG: beta-galactosidase [Spirochaetota bacterium]
MQNDVLPKKTFAFGTQYYRMVPFPADWERDIANIKAMGMDTIRFWALWRWVESNPGEYYLEDLHELMKIAEKNELDVILVIVMDAPPDWLYLAVPESSLLPLSKSGKGEGIDEAYSYVCWDNPAIRELGELFITKIVQQFKGYNNLLTIDVWNEPDKPECACQWCRKKFVKWLKGKFSSVDELNKAIHHPVFKTWADIRMPRSAWETPLYLLYEEFRTWSIAEQVGWAAKASKTEAPEVPVTVHCHSDEHPFTFRWSGDQSEVGWDDWEMKKQVDFYITAVHDFYQGVGAYTELQNIGCVIGNLETKRSLTGGQYWTTGLAGGASKLGIYGGMLTGIYPKENMFSLWLCVAHEARGVVYWQYRVERLLGPEIPGWGLAAFDGGDTFRTIECKEFIKALRPHEEGIMAAKIKKPRCAVLYSLKSHILNETQPHLDYISAFEGICFALWMNNVTFDVVNEKDKFSSYRIVYVPMAYCLENQTGSKLIDFVLKGGTLVLEPATASFSENGILNTVIPGVGLSIAAGVREKDVLFGEVFEFDSGMGKLRGVKECRIIEIDNAEIIGRYLNGIPAATKSSYGKGSVIYFTTNVSSALRKLGGEEYTTVLINLSGIKPEITVKPLQTVTTRVLENGNAKFIFIFNNAREGRAKADVMLPFSCDLALQVYSGDSDWSVTGNTISVNMAYREVIVLKVQ